MVSIYTAARQTALVLAAVCMGTSGAIAQPSAQIARSHAPRYHGNTVLMAGRDAGGALEFTSAQHRRGHLLLDRVTFRSVHVDTLRHVVEASFDLGETWTTLVESHYSRKTMTGSWQTGEGGRKATVNE